LCEEDSKKLIHLDANLTPRGVEQCNELSKYTRSLKVEAVLVSPMTRCLETAKMSFPHLYGSLEDECNNKDISGASRSTFDATNEKILHSKVPFVAYEEWRETVNYLCDCRRPTQVLQMEYPHVNFDHITHEHDPIWAHYEGIFGSHTNHTTKRESDDAISLCSRAHSAWKVLLNRPEKHLALVGHSAFFMHMFTPLFEELEGVVQYDDEDVREMMTGKFENCELRSVVADVP
jgi:hypothetical protein